MDNEPENDLATINKHLQAGRYCEIDVWNDKEQGLILGHDILTCCSDPQKITLGFLQNEQLLVHCKNLDTFLYLKKFSNIHSFYQDNDFGSLTTKGKVVTHQKTSLSKLENIKDIIACDLKCERIQQYTNLGVYGIIVDITKQLWMSIDYDEQTKLPFKLLILDVDGVLTNGKKIYDTKHEVQYKEFNDRDFTAIKRFKAAGVNVVLLTGDKWNSEYLSDARRLPTFRPELFSPQHELDKSKSLKFICDYNGVKPEECAFVGDDYYDITMLNSVGFPFCPNDAAKCVKDDPTVIVIPKNGGEGVIEELFNMYEDQLIKKFPYDNL
jgi:3-deoxy-D-manno-octulosonate 8-phosphate phosphatase (KDO 8-P phosphatase)